MSIIDKHRDFSTEQQQHLFSSETNEKCYSCSAERHANCFYCMMNRSLSTRSIILYETSRPCSNHIDRVKWVEKASGPLFYKCPHTSIWKLRPDLIYHPKKLITFDRISLVNQFRQIDERARTLQIDANARALDIKAEWTIHVRKYWPGLASCMVAWFSEHFKRHRLKCSVHKATFHETSSQLACSSVPLSG